MNLPFVTLGTLLALWSLIGSSLLVCPSPAQQSLVFAIIQCFIASVQRRRKKHRVIRKAYILPRNSAWSESWALCGCDDDLKKLPDKVRWERLHGLSVESFLDLLKIIKPRLKKKVTCRGKPISPRRRLMITLRYLSSTTDLVAIQQMYDVGERTVYSIIHETCCVIVDMLFSKLIRLPRTHAECLGVMQGFYDDFGVPNIIGAVDGTHIPIRMLPRVKTEDFINFKRRKSVVVQACVDNSLLFTDVYGIWPGSQNDASVLRASHLWELGESGMLSPEGLQCCILADSGYPCRPWLITPISKRNAGNEDPVAKAFNDVLSGARQVVEGAFGLLKSKWRRLMFAVEMETTDHVRNIVFACITLTNWYLLHDCFGVHEAWLQGRPDWGAVRRSSLHKCHRDLKARVEVMPQQAGEESTEKRTRAVFIGMLVGDAV